MQKKSTLERVLNFTIKKNNYAVGSTCEADGVGVAFKK